MSTYEEALAGLNEAQRRAVTTTEGPVLVIAGPGTGKTQLLTTRIAHILATTDTLPQNILALTFTESAAQTMQERLSNMIGQGAYDVTISTYHAFGSELIRRFPDYFNELSEQQPVEELGIDRTLRGIVRELPYSNPLKYSDMYLGDIKTLISDAKRALLAPDDLRTAARHNLQFIQQANPLVQETLAGISRIDKKSQALLQKLATQLEPLAAGKENQQSLGPLMLDALTNALAETEASGKTTPLTKWKNTWLAKNEQGQFVIDGVKTNQKLLAAADVYEQYLARLAKQQLYDYDDMILRAVRALETHTDLRFSLQEQYLYLLLDEFQDTNGAQLRLVELLSNNPTSEGRPNVLAVGDDDQAIYAFQGANYSHMLQFAHMYRDVLLVPLTENYRSHPDVLYIAKGIANQIDERLHHRFPGIAKNLTAVNKNLPQKAIVERREAQSDVMHYAWVTRRIRELLDSGMAPEEIAILAPQHKYLEPLVPFLQQEAIPVRYEKRENVLQDPAVNQLLRMSELALALARGDQPTANALWAQVLSFGFWELPTSLIWRFSWQVTDDDRNWTDELLEDPQLRPIALFFIRLGFLSGNETLETMLDYIIGVTPLDLAEPGYDKFTSPYYQHYFGKLTGQPPDAPASSSLTQAEPEIPQQNYRPYGESAAPERLLGAGASGGSQDINAEFWNLLTNLIVLRARLKTYHGDGEERLNLVDFIEFMEAHRRAELKILNTSPYASASQAVQLMTVYKAKGLEFTAVFVLAVNDEAWGSKAHTQSARISLPPNLQHIRYAGATNDERLRLFYVALTRAKTQLYLVNYLQNYAGKGLTRLKYLSETADEPGVVHSPLLPSGKQLVLAAEDSAVAPTTELAAYWQRRHETALTNADMQALLQDRLAQFRLSPSRLNDFIDFVHCGPQSFFLRTILRFPEAPRAEIQFGEAMHETLHWAHSLLKTEGALPSERQLLKTFERRLLLKRLGERDARQYTERGQQALRAYWAQRANSFQPTDKTEYTFRSEGVVVGEAHLTGQADRLIIDRENKTITIIDYKTGKSHTRWQDGRSQNEKIKLHKYRQQLYLYKILLEKSHTFAGYRVVDAYLEFVEPDEEGHIRQLHLNFDDTEQRHIEQLTQAMWQCIMRLHLPDTTSYSQDLHGIQQFEQDLVKRL